MTNPLIKTAALATFTALVAAPAGAAVVLLDTATFETGGDADNPAGANYFEAAVVDGNPPVYDANTDSFDLAGGTNRGILLNVAHRNQDIASVTYGGQTMTLVGNAAGSGGGSFNSYDNAIYFLGEAGVSAASDNDFDVTFQGNSNTSLILQAFGLGNVDQAGPAFYTDDVAAASAGGSDPDELVLSGLVAGGFGFTSASTDDSGVGDLTSDDPFAASVTDVDYNAHTGGDFSSAILANFAGGELNADWASTANDGTLAVLAYVNPIPEPASALVGALGIGLLGLRRRGR